MKEQRQNSFPLSSGSCAFCQSPVPLYHPPPFLCSQWSSLLTIGSILFLEHPRNSPVWESSLSSLPGFPFPYVLLALPSLPASGPRSAPSQWALKVLPFHTDLCPNSRGGFSLHLTSCEIYFYFLLFSRDSKFQKNRDFYLIGTCLNWERSHMLVISRGKAVGQNLSRFCSENRSQETSTKTKQYKSTHFICLVNSGCSGMFVEWRECL